MIFPKDTRIAIAKGREKRGQDGKNDFLTVSSRRKSGRLKPPAILGR